MAFLLLRMVSQEFPQSPWEEDMYQQTGSSLSLCELRTLPYFPVHWPIADRKILIVQLLSIPCMSAWNAWAYWWPHCMSPMASMPVGSVFPSSSAGVLGRPQVSKPSAEKWGFGVRHFLCLSCTMRREKGKGGLAGDGDVASYHSHACPLRGLVVAVSAPAMGSENKVTWCWVTGREDDRRWDQGEDWVPGWRRRKWRIYVWHVLAGGEGRVKRQLVVVYTVDIIAFC